MNQTSTAQAPKQTMRFSDEEIDLMRNSLLENDLLLKVVRKRLLQMPLDEGDQEMINKIMPKGGDLAILIKKTVHPSLDGDAPFFQMVDLYLNADVKDKPLENATMNILAREIMTEYLDEAFDKFYDFDCSYKNKFSDFTDNARKRIREDEMEVAASFLARNTLINHVDFQLNQLLALAATKKMTTEEVVERNKKKSTK